MVGQVAMNSLLKTNKNAPKIRSVPRLLRNANTYLVDEELVSAKHEIQIKLGADSEAAYKYEW